MRFSISTPGNLLAVVFVGLLVSVSSGVALGAPDLSVTKSCTSSGQSASCTVTVTNIGDVPTVAPLSITDTITGTANANLVGAGGSLPASCTPGAQLINGIPLTCPNVNTSLAPSTSGTFLVSYSMPQGGNFTNCVSVTAAQNAGTPGDPNASNNTNICTAFTVTSPTPTTGSITIVKDAQPNDAQDFTFTSNQATIAPFPLDDDSDSTLSNQKTFSPLPAGSYTFTETQMTGWTLSSLVCTGGTATGNTTTGTASITLAAGDNVTCTFTNAKPTTGSITIVKDAQPNDAQNFTFTSNQATIAPFPLDDDSDPTLSNQKTFSPLPAGIYTFTETQVTGWTLSSLVCNGGTATTNTTTGTASITLAAGDNVTCTFTNTKPTTGKLTIIKDAQPNDAQDFHFVATGGGLTDFDLDDDGTGANPLSNSITFSSVTAGVPITVTETAVSGWTVPSIQCLVAVPGATTTFTDQLNRTFTVNLEAGADVTCTFINVKQTGSITIVKDAQPNDAQDFTFTSNQATIAPFPLDDDSDPTLSNQKTFATLPAGTYSFTETPVTGWTLSSLVCTGGTATTNTSTGTASITLAAGNNVICTFTNTKPASGKLTIIKDTQPNDAQDFHFVATGGGVSDFDLDDDTTNANPLSNSISFSVATGVPITVTETAVSGWTVPSIQCLVAVPGLTTTFTDQLNRTFTVNLEAGADVTCTFINVKTTGSITIIKDAQPNDAQDFTFTSNQASIAPFPLDDDSDATLSNQKTFAGLPAGTYSFAETQISGWALSALTCTGASATTSITSGTATISLAAGNNVTCIFSNTKVAAATGKICGMKFNDLDGDGVKDASDLGLPNWQISTGVATIPPVTTGTKGEYCFSDLPAGTYTLAEIAQTPWQQTFPAAPGTHTVTVQAGQVVGGVDFGNKLPAPPCTSLLCGGVVDVTLVLTNHTWFEFFEDKYPDTFSGTFTSGTLGKYKFRFYRNSGNYLALDDVGSIVMMGPATDNTIRAIGSTDELKLMVQTWDQGPVPTARVFNFAEANFASLFKGTGTPGHLQQYNFRYYAETGNYLAVDTNGVVYLLGPATGNVIKNVGSAESFRELISKWQAALPE